MGWAEFTINEATGLFAVHSDWGHGHHYWPNRGGRTLKEELLRFSADYIMNKFSYEKKDDWKPIFDAGLTRDSLLDFVENYSDWEEDSEDKRELIDQVEDFVNECEETNSDAAMTNVGHELNEALDYEIYNHILSRQTARWLFFRDTLIPWFQNWLQVREF